MQAIKFFEPIVTNEYLETLPEEGKEVCVDLLQGRKYLIRTGDKEVEVHDVPVNRDEIPDNALFEDEAVIAYCEIKYCDYVSLEGLHPNRTIRLADDWILLTDYVEQAARIKRYSDRISKIVHVDWGRNYLGERKFFIDENKYVLNGEEYMSGSSHDEVCIRTYVRR